MSYLQRSYKYNGHTVQPVRPKYVPPTAAEQLRAKLLVGAGTATVVGGIFAMAVPAIVFVPLGLIAGVVAYYSAELH